MKWLGQHIVELVARFRSDVYMKLVNADDPPSGYVGIDSNRKLMYRTLSETRSDIGAGTISGINITDDSETAHSSAKGDYSLKIAGGAGIGTGIADGTLTIDATSSSTSGAGIVELATTAETTTGTATGLAVTPDGLKDGYQGSTNVTTLGTIATGTWQGTAIASGYLQNKIVLTSQSVYLSNPAANEIHMGNTNYCFDSDVITAVSVVDADPTTMSLTGNLAASGIVVPFNIKNIDVKAYYRPAQTSGTAPFSGSAASATVNSGDDITVAIRVFEASRPDQNNSTLTLTQRGAFTDTLTNAGGHKNKHYYQLDSGSSITNTINAGQLLFIGFEITDAGSHGLTGNVKFNYTVYADIA